jgi:uncharacterized membrane-anchored protein
VEARTQEAREALAAAGRAAKFGPADVPLLDQATLHVPATMLFVPPAEAGRVLRAWGNKVGHDPVGMLFGSGQDDQWAIVIRFVQDGYIKDDDAKDWDADKMLESIRDNVEEANKDRMSRGFPEMEVTGWVARPVYDAATHRLVSSLGQRQKGSPPGPDEPVNYITYALGRSGYFSLEMLTNRATVAHDRDAAALALGGLVYNDGHRYTDFDASTDHVAEYGLAALVGVVAAKKLGLLAVAGAFLLKFAKIGVLAVAGLGAWATKLIKKKRDVA